MSLKRGRSTTNNATRKITVPINKNSDSRLPILHAMQDVLKTDQPRRCVLDTENGISIGKELIHNYAEKGKDHYCWLGCHKIIVKPNTKETFNQNDLDDNLKKFRNNLELEHMVGWLQQTLSFGLPYIDDKCRTGERSEDEYQAIKDRSVNFQNQNNP